MAKDDKQEASEVAGGQQGKCIHGMSNPSMVETDNRSPRHGEHRNSAIHL